MNPHCDLPEWPFVTPHRDSDDYADAAKNRATSERDASPSLLDWALTRR